MGYVYLDESGDLGFDFSKSKTSRHFIVTALFVTKRGPVEKIVKKIFCSFSKVEMKSHGGTLHAYKERPVTRQRVLGALAEHDVTIVAIYLNKVKVYTHLQDEKHVLYNYVANILLDRIYTKKLVPTDEVVHLIASQRETNKFLNKNLCNYLTQQLAGNHRLDIDVKIRSPQQEKCLQIVDFASWAIFRLIEHGDESYFNLIKRRVVEQSPLFP